MDQGQRRQRAEREKRRSRVRSIRSLLVGFIFLWTLASIVIVIVLGVKLSFLEKRLGELLEYTETKVSVVQEVDTMANPVLPQEIEVTVPTAEENLAEVGDTKRVYLTFDDGPSGNTEEILKVLDDYGVKATFFVIGRTDDVSKERMRRIVEDGHTIAMHSYTHSYTGIYSSLDSFKNDVESVKNVIKEATGEDTLIYRFPGGSSNGIAQGKISQFITYLNDNDIMYMDWNVSSGDAVSPSLSVDAIVENVMKDVVKYKSSVVLMHDSDSKATTVEALPLLIERLRAEGCILLPISKDTTRIQHVTL